MTREHPIGSTLSDLLRLHHGDATSALAHLWESYKEVCRHVSVGKMRAGPPTDRKAKAYVEGLDIDNTDSPNG